MDELIKIILSNKDWIFSGIGVFVLSGIIFIIRKLLKKKKGEVHSESIKQKIVGNGNFQINNSKILINRKKSNESNK